MMVSPSAGAPRTPRPISTCHKGRGSGCRAPGAAARRRGAACGRLTRATSTRGAGSVRPDARAPGGVELQTSDLAILGPSPEFPITPKEHGIAFLFEHRHLWLRSKQQVAIARVRAEVVQAIRDFFYERHFTLVDTPILTGSIGEHAGTLFSVDYFDWGKASLAQTGQLYVEAAAAA